MFMSQLHEIKCHFCVCVCVLFIIHSCKYYSLLYHYSLHLPYCFKPRRYSTLRWQTTYLADDTFTRIPPGLDDLLLFSSLLCSSCRWYCFLASPRCHRLNIPRRRLSARPAPITADSAGLIFFPFGIKVSKCSLLFFSNCCNRC